MSVSERKEIKNEIVRDNPRYNSERESNERIKKYIDELKRTTKILYLTTFASAIIGFGSQRIGYSEISDIFKTASLVFVSSAITSSSMTKRSRNSLYSPNSLDER